MSFADVFCPSYTLVSNLVTSDLHRFCNSLSRQLNAVTITYVQRDVSAVVTLQSVVNMWDTSCTDKSMICSIIGLIISHCNPL